VRWPAVRFLFPIAIGIALLCAAAPLSAGIYSWTDEKGVRHYSNVAPTETDQEVQRLDEIPSSAPENRGPTAPSGTGPSEPAAFGDTAPADPGAEDKPVETGAPESASKSEKSPTPVPTEQNEIVQSEKAVVKELQRQLVQDASRRGEFVEKERQRLSRALEQLQKTPVAEFGSQKNKTRAMGYYRYRLEALEGSPDSYFTYGDSDID